MKVNEKAILGRLGSPARAAALAALALGIALGIGGCSSEEKTATTPGSTTAPVAIVLGEPIPAGDPDEVMQIILDRLFKRFREQNDLEVTDGEIDRFINALARGSADAGAAAGAEQLTAEEREQVATMRHDMGRAMIGQWKTNRALFRKYGGRVIGQQLGAEPLDAYREFLEDQEKAGAFEILDPDTEQYFWKYFRDDSIHSFLPPEVAATALESPPWEQAEP